jgi:hypothetical protein
MGRKTAYRRCVLECVKYLLHIRVNNCLRNRKKKVCQNGLSNLGVDSKRTSITGISSIGGIAWITLAIDCSTLLFSESCGWLISGEIKTILGDEPVSYPALHAVLQKHLYAQPNLCDWPHIDSAEPQLRRGLMKDQWGQRQRMWGPWGGDLTRMRWKKAEDVIEWQTKRNRHLVGNKRV